MTNPNPLGPLVEMIADAVAARLKADGASQRLLTVPEAAEYLRRTPRALRHLIAAGSVPAVRQGRSVRLDRRELDRWIELRQSRA